MGTYLGVYFQDACSSAQGTTTVRRRKLISKCDDHDYGALNALNATQTCHGMLVFCFLSFLLSNILYSTVLYLLVFAQGLQSRWAFQSLFSRRSSPFSMSASAGAVAVRRIGPLLGVLGDGAWKKGKGYHRY